MDGFRNLAFFDTLVVCYSWEFERKRDALAVKVFDFYSAMPK